MNKKTRTTATHGSESTELSTAIKLFVAEGGVINVVPNGESGESVSGPAILETPEPEADADVLMKAKVELLKGLIAKGAGVSALQYSLRMNRKDIKRLANENGLTIRYSQPVRGHRPGRQKETVAVDDVVAGHAMHYSSLGYTALEIAQLLGLNIRDVWHIGKAYRIEFKQPSIREKGGCSSPP
jgi:subtilisin family serine protease